MGRKLTAATVFWIFVCCIFIGITVGSLGIGTLFPSANRITKPFVCDYGQLELVTREYHPSPTEKDGTRAWYCIDPVTGAQQEINVFKMAMIAGPLYGLVLFCIVMEILWVREGRRTPAGAEDLQDRADL